MIKSNKTFTPLKDNIKEIKEEESDPFRIRWRVTLRFIFLLKDNYQGLEPNDNTVIQNLLYNDKKKIPMCNKLHLRTVVLL